MSAKRSVLDRVWISMKQRRWILGVALVIVVVVIWWLWPPRSLEERAAETLRRELRQQGFKTEPADFNLDIGEEARSRFHLLTNDLPGTRMGGFPFAASIAKPIGSNTARVLWKESRLPSTESADEWGGLREWLAEIDEQLDSARNAVLAGPVRSEPMGRLGPGMLLPYLPRFKTLAQALAFRAALRLKDGQHDDAWLDMRAVSRFATDWHPEPIRISQTVRAALVAIAQQITWEALQHPGWTEEQLFALQREWEAADLFKDLPESAAFQRVSYLAACADRKTEPMTNYVPAFGQTLSAAWAAPKNALGIVGEWFTARSRESRYRSHGVFEDELGILRFCTHEEIELRKAVSLPSWEAICRQSGATNEPVMAGAAQSMIMQMIHMQSIQSRFMFEHGGFVGRMSEAESRRRLIVVALALSRYRLSHGKFPDSLRALAPKYLAAIPADFMDARPLRYRRVGDAFLLYSVGLDCQDDGGISPQSNLWVSYELPPRMENERTTRDLLWPLPAFDEELTTERDAALAEWAENAASRCAFWQMITLVEAGLVPGGTMRALFPGEYEADDDSDAHMSEGEAAADELE